MWLGSTTGRIVLALAYATVCSCGGTVPQAPVKEVPVESSEPAAQAYAVEETEISGAEVIDSDLELEESGSDSNLPDRILLGEFPDGIPTFLSDYKNKVVLVNYWTSRCDSCGQIMSELEQLSAEYRGRGLVVLNVNHGETPQTVEAYLASRSQTSSPTQLADHSGQAAQGVGVLRVPAVILYRNQGEVARYMNTVSIERVKQDLDLILE